MRLVEAGWDAEVARRPHGQHTTVVAHLDVKDKAAALHLGPLLTDAERQYLTCDATCEVWFERDGQPIGAGPGDPADQPAAAPRAGAPPPHLRGSRVVVPPAVCTPTTSGIGRTAAQPSWPTWCCYAPITTGCTIAASSPSPDPQTISSSPTAPANHSVQDRWPAHRRDPHPRSRPAPGPPASAPTGGGINPSNPNHHQHSTKVGNPVEAQTGWGIDKFVRNPRSYVL